MGTNGRGRRVRAHAAPGLRPFPARDRAGFRDGRAGARGLRPRARARRPGDDGVSRAQVGADGAFRLSGAPGEATLTLTAIGGELDGLRLLRPLGLALGENRLDVALHLARIEVEGANEVPLLALMWVGEGGAFALRLAQASGGTTVQMPAGRVRLVPFQILEPDPRRWRALDECDVTAGESASLSVDG